MQLNLRAEVVTNDVRHCKNNQTGVDVLVSYESSICLKTIPYVG